MCAPPGSFIDPSDYILTNCYEIKTCICKLYVGAHDVIIPYVAKARSENVYMFFY